MDHAPNPLRFHECLDELAAGAWRERLASLLPGLQADALRLALHPGDQMLVHSLREHGRADVALSQYFAISLQQARLLRDIAAAHFAGRAIDVLDFACGYGRLLRLLPAIAPAQRTWASDIQHAAVAFVREAFGVHGIDSCAAPADFAPGRRFDLIWVASLFSHLPDALFRGWLRTLAGLLAPGGLLCFSVRDVSQLGPGATPAEGLRYDESSENADLDGAIYGTAWADERYVADALREAAPGRPWACLPRALANEQDLYLLAADADADLAFAASLRRGPWGWVDIARRDAQGIELQGWAASLDDGAVAHVEVRSPAGSTSVLPGIARPDVAAVLDDPRTLASGWQVRLDAAAGARVEVRAVDRAGVAGLLFAGTVAG